MITRERLEEILKDESNTPFKTKGVDHHFRAISLLRERIPYDVCREIIAGVDHDIIYLCDIDIVLPFISEEDLNILADCNLFVDDDNDCLSMFV